MTIVFLTSRHILHDDRIFYHMAVTLAEAGHVPVVISSREEGYRKEKGVYLHAFDGSKMSRKSRKEQFVRQLQQYTPERVICSDPLTVHTAWHFRKSTGIPFRLFYDITEWYPSKKELARHPWWLRPLLFPGYMAYNLLAALRTDAFIFGEWYKSRPYRLLFPHKDHLFLSYWPDLRYIPDVKPVHPQEELHLSYSGKLSREKGFGNFLEVVKILANKRTRLRIRITVIGWYPDEKEKEFLEKKVAALPSSVETVFFSFMPFGDYLETIRDTSLFLDLRRADPENRCSLPIRIFYYAAYGRPVIYSKLKAIRKEVEIDRFGFLVRPRDLGKIVRLIEGYLDHKERYLSHCRNARRLAEEKYNWLRIKDEFIAFLEKPITS